MFSTSTHCTSNHGISKLPRVILLTKRKAQPSPRDPKEGVKNQTFVGTLTWPRVALSKNANLGMFVSLRVVTRPIR